MIVCALLACISMASADVYTYTKTLTNGQPIAYSDAIPVSGYLVKFELIQDNTAGTTTTCTMATYNSTTAVDTYVSIAATTNQFVVARPRVLGTDSTGTAIAAASAGWTNASNPTIIGVYEKPMIGSNTKIALTGTWNDNDNAVTVRVYYEPVKK